LVGNGEIMRARSRVCMKERFSRVGKKEAEKKYGTYMRASQYIDLPANDFHYTEGTVLGLSSLDMKKVVWHRKMRDVELV
jgi:hypothetical protein